MKYIKLTQGKEAIVDEEDYEYLNLWKWYYNNGYAVRNFTDFSGKKQTLKMHRIIMSVNPSEFVDHINGIRFDNRKINLRIATKSQNAMNQKKSVYRSTSKYKGVMKNSKCKTWVAKIKYKQKSIYIGSFKTEIEAAKAYNEKAKELFGEFAKLNEV